MGTAFLTSLIGIVLINLLLSGDNALVIAMATLHLPQKQRKKAIFWGTFGAVALRVILTTLAAALLNIPFIRSIGGLLLAWIGIKLLSEDETGEATQAANSFPEAVRTIIIADFFMSLDNVLAVAGVSKGNIVLLIAGLLISVPLVIWGSSLLSSLMRKWKWLVPLGAGLIGFASAEMILEEPYLEWLASVTVIRYLISVLVGISVIVIGHLKTKNPVVQLKGQGPANESTKEESLRNVR